MVSETLLVLAHFINLAPRISLAKRSLAAARRFIMLDADLQCQTPRCRNLSDATKEA